MIIRDGRPEQARGSSVLEPGDEILLLADGADERALGRLFEGRPGPDPETAPT
jgi:Trk K+ transport system NAD-binding subunit